MSSKLFHRKILENSLRFGTGVALTDAETGEQLTFNELRRRSHILANYLHGEYGIGKGDVIICYMPNNIYYPIAFLAAALVGASKTGVNPEFKSNELADYIKKTKCRCIFTTSELLDNVVKALKGSNFPILVIGKLGGQLGIDLERILAESKDGCEDGKWDANVDEQDILLTPLSSGTTDKLYCVYQLAIFDKISEGGGRRTTIAFLPFYHASGFWALCYCLLTGHHSVVMQRFQAPLLLSCIEDYKVDTLNLVPAIVSFLLKNDALIKEFDLSSVRIVLCGSAPISRDLTQKFLERYSHVTNFVHVAGYGSTELVALSHLTPLELPLDDTKHVTSCGQLLPRFECKVIDLANGEEIHKPLERGELWLRSESIMKGYLNDVEGTRQCLDADRWYHSGDIVFFDEDRYFYVVDRIKNIIKVNGMQVSPLELESLLLEHENVIEASVVGTSMDGFGEVPRAFVALKHGASDKEKTGKELIKFVNDRVASHKHLRGGLFILPSLPKSAAGKVLREELKHWDSTFHLNSAQQLLPVFETLNLQVEQNNDNGSETFL
ncbi:4-coumarate--CoA ligase 2 [Aphelenchoides bicaudatus]|nr:4-coumarate--CoA ligase 2 [Aphelenchoides bicaudatus]